MPKDTQIHTLTSHVYGPYHDFVVFKETFPPDWMTLEVRDMQLYADNREVGFDDTEFIGTPPEGSLGAKNKKVVFFGIFKIPSLDCLSERGLEYLQRDLREYDAKVHLEHNQSGLTLQTLYGDKTWGGSKLFIRIACNKTLAAHFLTSRNDPGKLILYSVYEGKRRRFSVQSLHVTTFSKSRNFFDRYRLRALIEELIDTDRQKTPVGQRNIEWLIDRYLAVIHPRDAENRIIFDPDLEGEIASELRHLNHLPRARIRHYFAAQAGWLLAHMIASSSKQVKLLNIDEWIQFCRESRRNSIEANQNGVRWGVAHGSTVEVDGPYKLSHALAKFGNTGSFWKRKLAIIKEKKGKASKIPSRPLSPELPESRPSPRGAQFQYDPDFSETSTTDSERALAPVLTEELPDFFMQAPVIPDGGFSWTCPGQGCNYKINLLDLSHENLRILPDDLIRTLNRKSWKVNDEAVRTALSLMVSGHYESHLREINVGFFQVSSTSWCARPLQIPSRQNRFVIKQEARESQVRRSSRKPQPRRLFDR